MYLRANLTHAMKNIKHYSFDLWSTLIRSNPNFKKERCLFFHKHFNTLGKSAEETKTIFRTVDLMANYTNEKTGKNIDAEEMYLMVIYLLNNSHVPFRDIDLRRLYQEMEDLILQYIPVVYDSHTKETLEAIKAMPDTTLNLLSNTGFIKGVTLRKILDRLKLSKYFDFQLFSDELGISKPNPTIYQTLLENIHNLRNDNISLKEIVHIGDNVVSDIEGAESFGINAFQVNSNDNTIKNLIISP